MDRRQKRIVRYDRSQMLAVMVAGLLIGGWFSIAWADEHSSVDTGVKATARRWFEDAKFSMFIHWGVYSLLGKGEWVMNNDKLPILEYEKLPPRFNPVKFDAEEWVKLAKAAGMKYITVTTKHHDGFCMFESKLTTYDIIDATPYRKDPIKALASACQKQGVKLFFYYSLLDWHHPDYFPRGKTGQSAGREENGDWTKYVTYYQGQVRELCTNYGEIGGVWFDGWWDLPEADWDLQSTYRLIHELQPGALVGNNHHVAPFSGEDFQMFEQDLPGENSAGFNKAGVESRLPLETCLTMNQSWGYNARDTRYKSPEEVIHALLGAAGRGANLLLNVGPRPDGTIGPEFSDRLRAVGKWLESNGSTIYGTRRGPVPPQPWGVSTISAAKPRSVYLHILKPEGEIPLPANLGSFTTFAYGKTSPLNLTQHDHSLKLSLPENDRTPIDTIIVLSPLGMGAEIAAVPRGQTMHSEVGNPARTQHVPPGRIDRVGVILALATAGIVGWTAWMRFAPSPRPAPPSVGSILPPLSFIDLETSEHLMLLGLKGKVVWVAFWSAETPSGDAILDRLESVWRRMKSNPRFSLVAAAVNVNDADKVRAALAKRHATLPVYLADAETCRRFQVGPGDSPLHLLSDAQGRIVAIARGGDDGTIDRIEARARGRLEELDPMGNTRFAMIRPKDVVAARAER